jgi:predicted RNA-binding Zn ribbon-like protein
MSGADAQQHQHSVAAQGAPDQGAPGRLEVVRAFLNTRDVEDGLEQLATPAQARAWLEAQGLPAHGAVDAGRLRALREALRELLLANNGQQHDEAALDAVRAEAAATGLQVRFDANGASALVPAGGGTDAVVAELLGIVHESMAAGTWPRLKACRSDTCEWAFYDRSRNRSGTWCSMAVCGNRAKARSYRRRHPAGKRDS